jgi:DsbC/DsbD-like thiol-disulfide interchange protein
MADIRNSRSGARVTWSLGLAMLLALAAPALAADTSPDSSPWSAIKEAAVRLIAGSAKPDAASLRAGVEIKLAPGWHTYWRYPGDSGVPPRFDFSGSQNLRSARPHYPAPHLYTDETGNALGYKDDVIFPVTVTPQQVGQPVVLRMKIEYAICDKLCVPAEGQAELRLAGGGSANDAALKAAEARVPKPVAASQLGLSLRRLDDADKPVIAVDLKAPAGAQVFVEGPTPEWALPVPQAASGAPAGYRRFDFALDGLPPGVSPKGHFDLTFTVVEGDEAYETTTHLD